MFNFSFQLFQQMSSRGERESATPTSLDRSSSERDSRIRELELELERVSTRGEHLKSQNEVLELTLQDSKSLTDKLTVLLGKYESNYTALQLAQNYCDHMVESYDVLVALLETESGLLSANQNQLSTAAVHDSSRESRRAAGNRKSAEVVARHLLARMDKTFCRSDSGIGAGSGTGHHSNNSFGNSSHIDTTWEDSSGYSHTTR